MAATSPPPAPLSPDDWGDFVAAVSPDPPLAETQAQPQNDFSELPEESAQSSVSHSKIISESPSQSSTPAEQVLSSSDSEPLPNEEASNRSESFTRRPDPTPLQGFDTLDPVQRYALGAVTVVLLNDHATDLNGVAFARSQAATILQALGLRGGQQEALLALEPETASRGALVEQCTTLVGDEAPRFAAIQAMLALSVATGYYDARSRAFLAAIADAFGISWRAIAAVELAVAMQLFEQAAADAEQRRESEESAGSRETEEGGPKPRTVDELLIERRKKKMRYKKAVKIGGITLVGGVLFGLTGGLIAPGLLTALAGVGVASAAGLAASGTVASGAVVGGLFGVAGAGFTVKKARNRVSTSLEEFDFERPDDPRVIEQRKKKAERERKKLERLIAARLKEEAEANAHLAIEGGPGASDNPKPIDTEKELPRPPSEDEDEEEDESDNSKRSIWRRKKKREKLKVGSKGLEAASHVPGLHVCICVPAWLTEKSYGAALDQFEPALKQELPCSQHIALRWESRRLYEMGLAFAKFWASKATVTTLQQTYPHVVAAASTVAGAVAFAFAAPLTVMSCMDYVDNPWSILVSRSNGAGDELADVLVERSYGQRPVSLFGYSIGARVIFKCLESLASRGALGIVDNVYLMGAAVTADPERWKKVRPVVAGRIVNAYGSFDMALACFHRGCGHGVYIAGLRKVELEGVENLNMAYIGIEGHRELKDCVPRVMKCMGVGLGYIVMPPARLVKRKGRSKSRQRSDSPVCEEPERLSNRSRDTSRNNSPIENGGSGIAGLEAMQNDGFWDSGSPGTGMNGSSHPIDDGLTLPPNISSSDMSQSRQASEDQLREDHENGKSEHFKKKKSKSWLSWSSWGASGSKSGKKSKQKTHHEDKGADVSVNTDDASETIDTVPFEGEFEGTREEDLQESVHADLSPPNVFDERAHRDEHIVVDEDGVEVNDDIVAITGDDGDSAIPFDWEKQRRIWEEQERQMQERGYADSAVEIEMKSKIILGIGIEVAGRRICPMIEQDADLPVERKEEVFTNCMEDQQGVIIRLYEHEKRTKSVPINTLKTDEQYPKLLGELEVRFKEPAVKGRLRIAVAAWACENGDVCAEAEERLPDGQVGNKAHVRVPRSELCTMEERIRLEAAERKRIEAQIQKEMRARATPDVLALPAIPEEDANETVHTNTDKKLNAADEQAEGRDEDPGIRRDFAKDDSTESSAKPKVP